MIAVVMIFLSTLAHKESVKADEIHDYLKSIGVHHAEIVVSQAILETGWFKSYSFRERKNLFGLTNGSTGELFTFKSWKESCIAYRDMVQYKYKSGDYYQFLVDMHYASDLDYIEKLKSINYKRYEGKNI